MSIRMSPRSALRQGHACGPAEPDPRHPDGGAAVACGELCWRPPVVVVRRLKAAATGGGASGLGRRLHAVSLVCTERRLRARRNRPAACCRRRISGGRWRCCRWCPSICCCTTARALPDGAAQQSAGPGRLVRARRAHPQERAAGAGAGPHRPRGTGPARNGRRLTPCGVHEHFYSTNFAGEINRSTHYIVLAYEAERALDPASLPHAQHRGYRWLSPAAIVADPDVHPYTRLLQGVRAMTNPSPTAPSSSAADRARGCGRCRASCCPSSSSV